MSDVDIAHHAAIPEWVTLREASFITGQSEDALWSRIEAGLLSKDDHLSERLGLRFVLVRVQDLVATGLVGPGLLPSRGSSRRGEVAAEEHGRPVAPGETTATPPEAAGHADLQRLLSHIEREGDRPIFVNDDGPEGGWQVRHPEAPPRPTPPGGTESATATLSREDPQPEPPPDAAMVPSRPVPQAPPSPPVRGELPAWMTISEAAFLAGVDEDSLRGSVHAGRVTSDPSLVGRLGPRFLLVRTSDLVSAGYLDGAARSDGSGGSIPQDTAGGPAVPLVVSSDPPVDPITVPLAQATIPAYDHRPEAAPVVSPHTPIQTDRPNPLPPETIPATPSPQPPTATPPDLTSAAPRIQPRPPAPPDWAQPTAARPVASPRRARSRSAARIGRALGVALSALRWATLGLATGMVLLVVAPPALGYRTFVMDSGSMEPALSRGDLLIDRLILPTDATVGDIVTFRDPDHPDDVRTARVWMMERVDDVVRFETRGDAGEPAVQWSVAADGHISRVAVHVPMVGAVTAWFRAQPARALIVVVPLVVLPWLGRFRGRRRRFSWVAS